MSACNSSHDRILKIAGWTARLCSTLRQAAQGWLTASPQSTRSVADSSDSGWVALVGAGPGAADLLTLRALKRLEAADAVVYDRLVGPDILALLPRGCERYYVGKARGNHSVPQAEIGNLMVRLAGEGRRVVRLKGGDPGIFGRMGEELAALFEAGVKMEIVPGITAASGAVAAMGMPLTDRGHAQQVRFITAQRCCKSTGCNSTGRANGEPEWATLARRDETLVFYMGLDRVDDICSGLRRGGLPDDWPIMLIANASLPQQQTLIGTLADMPTKLAVHPLPSPCLIVVGSVVETASPTAGSCSSLECPV